MTEEQFQAYSQEYIETFFTGKFKDKLKDMGNIFAEIRKEAHTYRDSKYPFGIDDLYLIDGVYQTLGNEWPKA